MLSKSTLYRARHMQQLKLSANWKPIENDLRSELAATIDRLIHATEPAIIHSLRGRAQLLTEMLTYIDGIENIIRRFK